MGGTLPGEYNFVAFQGDDFQRVVTWTEDDGVTPIDLTNYSAAMQVRTSVLAPTTILSLTSPTELVVGGAAGTVTINITAAVTTTLTPGQYVYDLQVTSPVGVVTTLLKKKFIVEGEVTR
jgi:hypothetical protein